MAFDGIFLNGISQELAEVISESRVEKIHQPSSTCIVMQIRAKGVNHQLLISSHPTFGRVHLTIEKKINPSHPPLFCMVLRKHLTNGKIIAISQPGLERVLTIKFSCYNELGDLETKNLICEIMGKHSNIILTDEKGIIIDAIKRVSHHLSRYREILPGRPYLAPPNQNKLALTAITEEDIAQVIISAQEQTKLTDLLVKNFQGISPLLAKELIYRCGFPLTMTTEICGLQEIITIFKTLTSLAEKIKGQAFTPSIAYHKREPIAFSAISLTHLADHQIKLRTSVNEAADEFFQAKEKINQLNQGQGSLAQKILLEMKKLEDKLALQQQECQVAEADLTDKIKGQLLIANLYQIAPGQSSVTLVNYFDPDAPEITIALDQNLSPADNAQAYFKHYQKSKKKVVNLTKQLQLGYDEHAYLETILINITHAAALEELTEIKAELIEEGYLPPAAINKKNKKVIAVKANPYEFTSTAGFKIMVGKNNKQNDWLTLKSSKEDDLWLHAKKIPGAHVLIKAEGKAIPETTIYQGALLAAYFSKARHANQVPVDYTLRKYVKKPAGAKPGMVIYVNEKTIYAKITDPWLNTLNLDH